MRYPSGRSVLPGSRLTGGAFVFTLLIGLFSIIGMIPVAAALIYLLDTRPALRDAVDGHGSW